MNDTNSILEPYFDTGKRGKAYQNEKEYMAELYAFLDLCMICAGILMQEPAEDSDRARMYGTSESDALQRRQIRNQLLCAGEYLKERMLYTPHAGRDFKLRWLSLELALSDLERFMLLVGYASVYHAKYGKVFAELQESESLVQPTLLLVFSLYSLFADLSDEEAGRLIQGQSVVPRYLCDCSKGIPGRPDTYSFTVNRRTCSFLAGYQGLDRMILRFASYSSAQKPLERILIRQQQMEELGRCVQYLASGGNDVPHNRPMQEQRAYVPHSWSMQEQRAYVLHSYGPSGNGKKLFLRHAAKKLGYGVIFADVEKLETASYAEMEQFADGLAQECILLHAVLCLVDPKNREETEEDEQRQIVRFPVVLSCLLGMLAERLPFFVWISQEKNRHLLKQPVRLFCMEHPMLTVSERIVLWQEYGRQYPLSNRTDLVLCANQYMLSVQGIRKVFETAELIRIQHGAQVIEPEHIRMAVRQQSPVQLGRFASLIPSVYQWEDLVVSQEQRHQMHLICDQLKYRSIVGEEWGFFKKTAYGRGICALFYGAPGTGKTMAVQVMANELGLDLYRVDLSQMVSKYIGETEKNISELFKRAKNINALLFFDEADALFAKRSEVKDSHDRNANAQTAHLLQKLEDYEGIAILATNYIQNIDDAFKRRIRFMVNFSFPPPEVRLELWNTILPKQVPCEEELDFEYFAQHFELSGSSIKEVLTNAAFIAAAKGEQLANRHIVEAVRLNFSKYGKLLTDQDFGYLCE